MPMRKNEAGVLTAFHNSGKTRFVRMFKTQSGECLKSDRGWTDIRDRVAPLKRGKTQG